MKIREIYAVTTLFPSRHLLKKVKFVTPEVQLLWLSQAVFIPMIVIIWHFKAIWQLNRTWPILQCHSSGNLGHFPTWVISPSNKKFLTFLNLQEMNSIIIYGFELSRLGIYYKCAGNTWRSADIDIFKVTFSLHAPSLSLWHFHIYSTSINDQVRPVFLNIHSQRYSFNIQIIFIQIYS